MRLLDVTLKDLKQSSRNFMVYAFAFVIPLLVTLLFLLIFGGLGGDEGFELPNTTVVVANLDAGAEIVNADGQRAPAGSIAGSGGFADLNLDMPQDVEAGLVNAQTFGQVLTALLLSETLADFIEVSEAADEGAARTAVDEQEAGVAIIIPPNFTAAMVMEGQTADVEIYKDPTLAFGPAIVESIVSQVIDNFAAGTIAMSVAVNGLVESGVIPDQAMIDDILDQVMASQGGESPPSLVETRLPPGADEASNIVTEIVSLILGGMMIFFVFMSAAGAIETILSEEERGTLQRLFTTPASHQEILGGKTLTGMVTVTIQMIVLMSFGHFIFGIDWGDLLTVALAVTGIIFVSAAAGLFLVSFMQNTRQGGVLFGGVLTVTGMMGLIPVFTAGNPNQPESLQTVSLLVPQGWAMRGLTTAMDGGAPVDMLPVLAGLLAWTLVLGFIGMRRLQRRFA